MTPPAGDSRTRYIPYNPVGIGDVSLIGAASEAPLMMDAGRVFAEDGLVYIPVASGTVGGDMDARAREVARLFHDVKDKPSEGGGIGDRVLLRDSQSTFELVADPEHSYFHLSREVGGELPYRPDPLEHLRPRVGAAAGFFMIAFHLPYTREEVFGREWRTIHPKNAKGNPLVDRYGDPVVWTKDVRLFDVVHTTCDGLLKRIHVGGAAVFDRHDLNGDAIAWPIAVASDFHTTPQVDERLEQLIDEVSREAQDPERQFEKLDELVRFNNPNSNFCEAFVSHVNEVYESGDPERKVNMVLLGGDDVHASSIDDKGPRRAKDASRYFFSRCRAHFRVPVFAVAGNHERMIIHPSLQRSPGIVNLTREEVAGLERDRYQVRVPLPFTDRKFPLPIVSYFYGGIRRLFEETRAVDDIYEDQAMEPYFALGNPFPDVRVNLGNAEPQNPNSREFWVSLWDWGGTHIGWPDPSDPKNRNREWAAPGGLTPRPGESLGDAFYDSSPDLDGPSPAQLADFQRLLSGPGTSHLVFSHAGFTTNNRVSPYHPHTSITPLRGPYLPEDLTYATVIGGGNEGRQIIAEAAGPDPQNPRIDRPNPVWHLNGHNHFHPNWEYAFGEEGIYGGPILQALGRIDRMDRLQVRSFSLGLNECGDRCAESLRVLSLGAAGAVMRDNPQYTVHLMAAGAGPHRPGTHPGFMRVVINEEGFISQVQPRYFIKDVEPSPEDPRRSVFTYGVSDEHLPNSRLVESVLAMARGDPGRLDLEGERLRLRARLLGDDGHIPDPETLGSFARSRKRPEHFYLYPEKEWRHLRLRTETPRLYIDDRPDLANWSQGVSAEFLFSRYDLGNIIRDAFQGLSLSYFRVNREGEEPDHLFSGAISTNNFLNEEFVFIPNLRFRASSLQLGGEFSVGEDSHDVGLRLWDRLNIFELFYPFKDHYELNLGFSVNDILSLPVGFVSRGREWDPSVRILAGAGFHY